MTSSAEFRGRLDAVIRYGLPGVQIYFDEENGFAARSFHQLGRDSDVSMSSPAVVTSHDLLALTFLDVSLPPQTSRQLLTAEGQRVIADLASVEVRFLWEANDWSESGDLAGAWRAWRFLREELEGIDWVIATKILARLRPHLVPVLDTVVKKVLGYAAQENDWQLLGTALGADSTRGPLEEVRDGLGEPEVPLLRVLDAATWMLGGRANRVKWALGRIDREESWGPRPAQGATFATDRASFWNTVREADPLDADG